MESYSMYYFGPGFFHAAQFSGESPKLYNMSVVHSIAVHPTIRLQQFVRHSPAEGHLAVSGQYEKRYNEHLRTRFCVNLFSLPWGKGPEVHWLGCREVHVPPRETLLLGVPSGPLLPCLTKHCSLLSSSSAAHSCHASPPLQKL